MHATTRETAMRLLLKQGESSASALAGLLGISVQAIRRHLRSLEQDGLVEARKIALGPGRPSNIWQLTTQGNNLFNNNQGTERLALDLLSSIQSYLSPDKMERLLSQQLLSKVVDYRKKIGIGSLQTRLQKLIKLRNEEGFLVELHHSEEDKSSWFINAFHCSIQGIAKEFPVLCDQELDLLRELFPECDVQRVQWRLESGHSCGYQVKLIDSNDRN